MCDLTQYYKYNISRNNDTLPSQNYNPGEIGTGSWKCHYGVYTPFAFQPSDLIKHLKATAYIFPFSSGQMTCKAL